MLVIDKLRHNITNFMDSLGDLSIFATRLNTKGAGLGLFLNFHIVKGVNF